MAIMAASTTLIIVLIPISVSANRSPRVNHCGVSVEQFGETSARAPQALIKGRVLADASGMAGFWTRVEDWLLALQADRERAARYFLWAWYVSTAVVVLGVALMLAMVAGVWHP